MPNTKNNRLVLIGGGGHALVVADAVASAGLEVAGFFDDDTAARLSYTVIHLGPIEGALAASAMGWIVAVGDVKCRAGLIDQLRAHEHEAVAVVHASAVVSPSASIGRGVFVGPGAIVNARAQIGEHAIVNSGAVIEHECVVGVNTHVAPGAVLGGGASVGANTLVGIGSAVLPSIKIGSGAVVGAGSVVIDHVPDGGRVAGTPAQPLD